MLVGPIIHGLENYLVPVTKQRRSFDCFQSGISGDFSVSLRQAAEVRFSLSEFASTTADEGLPGSLCGRSSLNHKAHRQYERGQPHSVEVRVGAEGHNKNQ